MDQYRHELKFMGFHYDFCLLENRVKQICSLDVHAGSSGTYRIRSLYFDTYTNQCFFENEAGVDERSKYRIRIYDGDTSYIRLECKKSLHGLKRKETCQISKEQCVQLMNNNPIPIVSDNQSLLKQFLAERSNLLLRPKVIVEYTRVPYVYRAGNVRITFDRQIAASEKIEDFLKEVIPVRGILPIGQEILEVKYDNFLPSTINELLSAGQNLEQTSFSKYALCRSLNRKPI